MPLRRAFDRCPGFFDPDCTGSGACERQTDDSALVFVYVNYLPYFWTHPKFRRRPSSNGLLQRDFLRKADRPFKFNRL